MTRDQRLKISNVKSPSRLPLPTICQHKPVTDQYVIQSEAKEKAHQAEDIRCESFASMATFVPQCASASASSVDALPVIAARSQYSLHLEIFNYRYLMII